MHHVNESVYDHSMKVAYESYKYAKKHHLNVKNICIGAILHDFYFKPWQEDHTKKKFRELHGFVHARQALENYHKVFPEFVNEKVDNAILRHMFPLNLALPKYKESVIVCIADKICAMWEMLTYIKKY